MNVEKQKLTKNSLTKKLIQGQKKIQSHSLNVYRIFKNWRYETIP